MRETRIKHINEGFTQSKKKYLENIAFWEKYILSQIGEEYKYKQWLQNVDGHGKLVLNGNPAFSLIDKNETKALRIMQLEPRSNKPYLAAWIEDFEMNGKEIPVLAIGLELSSKTQMASLNLIELWFNNYESSSFKKVLERYNALYKKNYTPSAEEKAFELHEEINEEINSINWSNVTLYSSVYNNCQRLFELRDKLSDDINYYKTSRISSITKIYSALTLFNTWFLSVYPSAKKVSHSSKYSTRKVNITSGKITASVLLSKHIKDIKKLNSELLHELQEKE